MEACYRAATEGLSEALLSHLRIRQGILIRDVRQGSPAAKLGLKPLDIVPDLGRIAFDCANHLQPALRAGQACDAATDRSKTIVNHPNRMGIGL